MPTTPGTHELECATWRPVGTLFEQMEAFFVGGSPQVKGAEVVYTAGDRYRLRTESAGYVLVSVSVILRNFHTFGVEN